MTGANPCTKPSLLLDEMELDPVEQRVVVDRSAVGRAATQGLAIGFAGESNIHLVK